MLVDDDDFVRMSSKRWKLSQRYPYTSIGSFTVLAHRYLLARELSKYPRAVVDHINRNPFDNRRANLRITNQSVNVFNARLRSDNKSGIIGVHFYRGRWVAFLGRKYLGRFATLEDAALARAQAEGENKA